MDRDALTQMLFKLLVGERDSIEAGDSKRGKFKAYVDIDKPEEAKKKIQKAAELAREANQALSD